MSEEFEIEDIEIPSEWVLDSFNVDDILGIVGDKVVCIYAIVCDNNKHRYIGSSIDVKRRWRVHISMLQNNNHHCPKLQAAWRKHGARSFSFIVLEYCNKENIVSLEQYYIDTLLPEYNESRIAGRVEMTDEVKRKLSDAHKRNPNRHLYKFGLKKSEETKARISAAKKGKSVNKGRTFSEETKKKMSEAAKNRVVTDITRKKMSMKAKLRQRNEEGKFS